MRKIIVFDFSDTLVKMRPPKLLASKYLLRSLTKKYTLVIITGARRAEVENILTKTKVFELFAKIITKDDSPFRKPNPKLVQIISKTYNSDNIIIVGDSNKDYFLAKNSKLDFFYVGKKKLGVMQDTNINMVLKYILDKYESK